MEKKNRTIQKLKGKGDALSRQIESVEDNAETMESLLEQNRQLSRDKTRARKLEEQVVSLKEENDELRGLLSDKEQLSEAIEFLIVENKRYREEQQELQQLLDQAKSTAAELREKLDESMIGNRSLDDMDEETRSRFEFFQQNEKQIKEAVRKLKEGFLDNFSHPDGQAENQEWVEFLRNRNKETSRGEDMIKAQLQEFNSRSGTFSARSSVGKTTELEEKKQLLGVLNDQLESAESRLKGMQTNLDGSKSLEESLEALHAKLRGKDEELQRLREQLNQSNQSTSISSPNNLKEGWLTKRGEGLLGSLTWRRRFFALAPDDKLYYAKSPNERFQGAINLDNAYVQADLEKKFGKEFCFIINVGDDKRTYQIFADTKKEMNDWIETIDDRIKALSFS